MATERLSTLKFSSEDDDNLIGEVRKYTAIYNQEDEDYKNVQIKNTLWNRVASAIGKDVTDCKKRWKSMRDNYYKNRRRQLLAIANGTSTVPLKPPPKWSLYHRLDFLDVNLRLEKPIIEANLTAAGGGGGVGVGVGVGAVGVGGGGDEDHEVDDGMETKHNITTDTDMDDHDNNCDQLPKRLKNEPLLSTELLEYASASPLIFSNSRSVTPQTGGPNNIQKKKAKGFQKRSLERVEVLKEIFKSIREDEDDIDAFMRSIAISVKQLPIHMIPIAKMRILSVLTELQYPQTMIPLSSLQIQTATGQQQQQQQQQLQQPMNHQS